MIKKLIFLILIDAFLAGHAQRLASPDLADDDGKSVLGQLSLSAEKAKSSTAVYTLDNGGESLLARL